MRSTAARFGSIVLVLVAGLLMSAGSPARAAGTGVQLDVSTAEGTYRPGVAVPLRFVVTNRQAQACALSSIADGSVSVAAATRDGVALTPAFSRALLVGGSSAMLAGHVATVEPAGQVSFGLEAADDLGLTVETPLRDESALAAVADGGAGEYRFDLVYQASPLAGDKVCAGRSNTATVTFRIGNPRPLWLIIGAGTGVLLLILAVVLLARRRRVVASAALLMLVVGGSLHATPARAEVTFSAGSDGAASVQYAGCVGKISAADPTIYGTLDAKGAPQVRIYRYVHSERVPLRGGGPKDSLIKWDNEDTGQIPGEAKGVNYDPCAELYHELVHAKDAAEGKLSDAKCGDSNVLNDEIRATIAENVYRAKNNLPLRTGYGGLALPKSMAECAPKMRSPNKKPPAKAGNRCAVSGCGGSNGDPHLTTFDNQRYSFQAVGEFTAVDSAAGDLTVQVRQSPLPGTTTVSVNSAIAFQVGAAKLGFYLNDGVIEVRGDTDLTGGASLSHGVDPYTGDVYDVTWADGTVASLWRTGAYGLVLLVAPAAGRAGTLSGLLGDFDGDIHDDVAPKGGAPIASPSFDTLYPAFADSWRITDATSLFDYADGRNTASFTDRAYPAAAEPQINPAMGTAARAACDTAGVTDPVDLANCVLDVALTGAADFAATTADVATLTAASSPSGGVTASVTAPGEVAHHTFTGAEGQRAYVKVVSTTLPDQCGSLSLRASGGKLLAIGCINATGEIDGTPLPTDGEYTIDVDPDGDAVGEISLSVALSKDQEQATTIGGESVTATIGAAGALSRITFTATAGQQVTVEATGSTIADQCGVLQLRKPGGNPLAEGCLMDGGGGLETLTLADGGRYTVIVDPARSATGQVVIRVR